MDLLAGLGTILPEDRVVSSDDELERHGGGVFTYHTPVQPDAVVYPQSRDEVVEILRFANGHRIPIVPFGQGSSLEAHTLPVHGGISLELGRMAGTNASGTNAIKYGVMRDQVLGLEVVLGDGTVMRTGGMAMKSSAGYNLTGLFVGSEGTLGG